MPGEVVTKGHGNGRHRELGEEGSTPQKLMDEPEAWTEAKGVRGVKNDVKPDARRSRANDDDETPMLSY